MKKTKQVSVIKHVRVYDYNEERGLKQYGTEVVDEYKRATVIVRSSSSSAGPRVWLEVASVKHETTPLGWIPAAHLSSKMVRAVIRRLQTWLDMCGV